MNSPDLTIVGCGIVQKELDYIIHENGWNIKTQFACSSLHVDFDMLWNSLDKMLTNAHKHSEKILVLYGTCHPLIDNLINKYNSKRIPVQNCIELLLGKDIFTQELSDGAFFLLEDWAKRWKYVTSKVFGENLKGEDIIFKESHTKLLALKTPTSNNFEKEAEEVGQITGLPLEWRDINLDIMAKTVQNSITELINE